MRDAFPADAPPGVLARALGYVLQSKWNWRVKFCCKAKDARLPHTMPVSWAEDVMVVMPADRMTCVVDFNFRDKFVIRNANESADRYSTEVLQQIPSVYVGSVSQLLRDVERWSAAIETVFQRSALNVPPWRSKRSFQLLYKFCLECDATEAGGCMRHIGSQLEMDDGALMLCSGEVDFRPSEFGAEELQSLRHALVVSWASAAGMPRLLEGASEPMDYDFEKEESPAVSTDSDHSGLSYLLNSR